ncbi:MAG: SH3 domain-containing protein [Anaerolineae bacterium]|nr:SH3 domain-containing protein [Anaerolineae bacterium]
MPVRPLLHALIILAILISLAAAQELPHGTATARPSLNVRAGPSEHYAVRAGLPYGTPIVLETRDLTGQWLRVHTADRDINGWVTAFFVEVDGGVNLMDLPIDPTAAQVNGTSRAPIAAPEAGPAEPVTPVVGEHAREIFRHGQTLGNDPHVFTVVGDCNSYHHYFLALRGYTLGQYDYLQPVIDHFAGSFGHPSQAAWQGFAPASVLDPTWANPVLCAPGETPLACEYRIRRPSVVFINLGSVGYDDPNFMVDMETLVEYTIAQGIIPILGTKADNVEGNGWVNLFIAQLAADYDVPLWNFWRAVQGLPNYGLHADNWHLTWAPHDYTDYRTLEAGWPVRNLSALQALDAVWRGAMD